MPIYSRDQVQPTISQPSHTRVLHRIISHGQLANSFINLFKEKYGFFILRQFDGKLHYLLSSLFLYYPIYNIVSAKYHKK
jgi:cbb3-type cytochrome oxidase subunit 1